jgi:hypothetical protein
LPDFHVALVEAGVGVALLNQQLLMARTADDRIARRCGCRRRWRARR